MQLHLREETAPDSASGGSRVTRHPYRSVGVVLTVMALAFFLAGMIGQFNDGPWGGLPEWLGAVSWFTFLASILVLLLLVAYLGVSALRLRSRAIR